MFFKLLVIIISLLQQSNTLFRFQGVLSSLKSRIVHINFQPLIRSATQCKLEINQRNKAVETTYSTILSKKCSELSLQERIKEYQIWNFEEYEIEYEMILSFSENDTIYSEMYKSQVYFYSYKRLDDQFLGAIIPKKLTEGTILPFNLINLKLNKVFCHEIGNKKLKPNNITAQPFLETYWTELDSQIILMPWIPYFSNCDSFNKQIFFQDLLNPKNCYREISTVGKLAQYCKDNIFEFNCILDELNIKSSENIFWWQTQKKIIYYLFPYYMSSNQLIKYNTGSYLRLQLAEISKQSFVPVQFYSESINTAPNYFDFVIDVLQRDNKILQAQIFAKYNPELQFAQQNTAKLHITIKYLTQWQSLKGLHGSPLYYIGGTLFVTSLLIYFIYKTGQGIGMRIKYFQYINLLGFPIVKGYCFFLLTGGLFILCFYFLQKGTSFSLINTTFDGAESRLLTLGKYLGRHGLILIVSGLFLLSSSINQTIKVTSPEQTRIIIQDDLQAENSNQQYNSEDLTEKQNFIIKTLQSQRKQQFLISLAIPLILLYYYYYYSQLQITSMSIAQILIDPILKQVFIFIFRYIVVHKFLYLVGFLMAIDTFSCVFIFRANNIEQFLILYFTILLSNIFLQPLISISVQIIKVIVYKNQDRNFFLKLIWQYGKSIIILCIKQSCYEKSLYYGGIMAGKLSSILMKPIFIFLLYLSLGENQLHSEMVLTDQEFSVIYSLIICFIPLEIVLVFFSIHFVEKKLSLQITQMLDFNYFRFQKRKIKWTTDIFALNRSIFYFYREFQKFAFSSQFYLILFNFSFSIICIFLGLKIIIDQNYIIYGDPVFIVMFIIVWFTGTVLSFILSFITIKLKLYEKKEEGKMRARLQNTQKILKTKDYENYLDLEPVKHHFLGLNLQWIAQNITQILTHDDFKENNCEILTKYKFYRGISKKKLLEVQRTKKAENKEPQQRKSHPLTQEKPIVSLLQSSFNKYAKPMLYSWFYIAKQSLYLKRLVQFLRVQKLHPLCQICNMDIQLQVVTRKPFHQIVNKFRMVNVGRGFVEEMFIQFYKNNQEFITVCSECKDKKAHFQKKTIKNGSKVATKMILRWLILTRSKCLHYSQIKRVC